MSLGERLERRAVEALAGRGAELQRLQVFTYGDGPPVMHIQGIPGVGKTHLLNALAATVGAKSVFVVRIDARWCEPSQAAYCRAICRFGNDTGHSGRLSRASSHLTIDGC